MKKFFAGLLAAMIGLATVAQPALAAAPSVAQSFGFQCDNGVCKLELDLGVDADEQFAQGVWLEVMEESVRQAPDGLGLVLDDSIMISMPTGVLSLTDAELYALIDDGGAITNLHGSALLPLPTLGLTGDMMPVTLTRVEFGYDLGAQLTEFNAPLSPDRRYAYFKADAGLRVLMASTPGVEVSPAPGQQIAVVADLTQPMLWFDGEVTVRTDGNVAFLREFVEPIEGLPLIGDALPEMLPAVMPVRQTVTWEVEGQVGQGVEPKLTFDASTQVDAGMVGKWLELESVPLMAKGTAMISPAGLLVSGSAVSDVSSSQVFGTDVVAQVFVPFQPAVDMTAEVAAGVQVPFLGIDEMASGRIVGDPQSVVAVTQGAWQTVQGGATSAGDAAAASMNWVALQGEDGYRYIVEQAGRGWSMARTAWCGFAGQCELDEALASTQVVQ